MNKSELINEVYGALNGSADCCGTSDCKVTKVFAEKVVNIVFDAIANGIRKDENVQVVGFGTFSVAKREPRMGVNPRTGDKISIGASKSIKFKAGAKLKEVL